ncbi:MAG: hypothetical protein AAF355_09795 [Myxococcota bacterium]
MQVKIGQKPLWIEYLEFQRSTRQIAPLGGSSYPEVSLPQRMHPGLDKLILDKLNIADSIDNYLPPTNELDTDQLRSIFGKLGPQNAGTYLTTGADRALVHPYFAGPENISQIIIADIDPEIYWFHQLTAYLLKQSTSHEQFLRLRKNPVTRTMPPERLNPDNNVWKRSGKKNRQSWQLKQDTKKLWNHFLQHSFTPFKNTDLVYGGEGNYLRNPEAYHFLKRLADRGRIVPLKVNLIDPVEVSWLIRIMQNSGDKLRVFDMSNIWWTVFSGDGRSLMRVIDHLRYFCSTDALLVACMHQLCSENKKLKAKRQLVHKGFPLYRYNGFWIVHELARTGNFYDQPQVIAKTLRPVAVYPPPTGRPDDSVLSQPMGAAKPPCRRSVRLHDALINWKPL